MKIANNKKKSYLILVSLILLVTLGLFILYSASYTRESLARRGYTLLQLKWIIIGIALIGFVFLINYKRLLELSYILYAINIILLLFVIFIAQAKSGVHRWLTILGINFQPSELMKLVIILTLARFLSSYKHKEDAIKCVVISFFLILLPIFLIVNQPDLGTALIFIPLLFVMLYVWGIRLKHILLTIIAGIALTPCLWHFLKDYQKERLLVFINPNIDPLGAGYTIIQSKIAIGSGGIFGKGWLQGTQSQLNFLPEHHTDFIFSCVGEEWGLVGALIIIMLYFIIIWEGLNIAQNSTSMEKKLIAVGISTLFALHVIINICMSIGLMPVVGLPLPFISYGGSAMIVFLILIGILLNIRYDDG